MLTEEQIRTFKEQGFLNYGPVLTPDETAELRDALKRVMSGKSEVKPESNRNLLGEGSDQVVVQIVNIWEAEPAFRAHLSHPKIVNMVAQLMGTDTVRVWHDQIQVKPSHIGGPTLWHQDFPYWPVITPSDLVSAWVAIDDATEENGCMSMVPRSHKWGPYNGGTIGTDGETYGPAPKDLSIVPDGDRIEMVPCPVPAGGVVFHHCLTWHGAPPNFTNRGRPAIAVHYMPGYTRYQPEPGKTHLIEHHINVPAGEPLVGDHFPTVLEGGRVVGVTRTPTKE